MTLRLAIVIALLLPAVVKSQQPAATAAIRTLSGVVLTASDVPLARVRVAVAGAPATDPPVLTDERGRFTVRGPDADPVRLTFTKGRYAAVTLDVRRTELNAVNAAGMRVRLLLGGAISGQVRDRFGAPVMQTTVTARQMWPPSSPEPPLQAVTTDDLGEFRFGGLAAGVYTIGVRPVPSINSTAQQSIGEQSVNVSLGSEVGGLDLTIDVPSELSGRRTGREPVGAAAAGSVRGRVTTPRGAPIAGAIVQAYGPDSGTPVDPVETDARGRYVIEPLAAGAYSLMAFKRGYIPPIQRQTAIDFALQDSPARTVVAAVRGGTVDAVDLILGRGASMSGTIVDEFGEPMQGVTVSAFELRAVDGRTRAMRVSAAAATMRTDDRGRYRLFGLQPGTYVVQARSGDILSTTRGYAAQFYPGTPLIDVATAKTLDVDEAATGIDFTLLPGPTGRVRGRVLDPSGNVPQQPLLTLMPALRSTGIQAEPIRGTTTVDGTFLFNNVPPGEYVIQASALGPPERGANIAVTSLFAAAPVTVAADDAPLLSLRLSRGAVLMGRVVYEGIVDPPSPSSGVNLTAISADPDRDPLFMSAGSNGYALLADNTFEFRGIFGRNVLISQRLRPEWYLKSITFRGQDLADAPFDFGFTETFRDIEVVVSAGAAAVDGRVFDDRATPVRDSIVVAFAADRSKWTLRSRWLKTGRSAQDGSFRLTGLVPGDYWVVAVDRLDGNEVAGDLQNPEVLDSLASRAQRMALGEGQSQSVTLRLLRR